MANLQHDKITLAELGEHRTLEDLWIAVKGKVYNLTSFASDHPGGIDVLRDCAGTDGTETYDYAGHSADSTKTMQRFLVGNLAEYTSSANFPATSEDSAAKFSSINQTSGSAIRLLSSKAWSRLCLMIFILGFFAAASWGLSKAVAGVRKVHIPTDLSQSLNPFIAFLGGLLIASSITAAGLAILYSQFSRTLKHEKEIFSYPPIIPRRRVRQQVTTGKARP